MNILLAQSEGPSVDLEGAVDIDQAPTNLEEAVDVVVTKVGELWTGLLLSLPIILIGLVIFAILLVIVLTVARTFRRGISRAGVEPTVAGLLHRIVRTGLIFGALLFALSITGVRVGAVLGALAVLGFVVGLAVQGILENFVAGVILLIRQPFKIGDQIISGDYEGTVKEIDFRVTRLVAYDGTLNLVPNSDVYGTPIINLTRRGKRRTTVGIGVDYRDDQDQAREVLLEALRSVDGVMEDPAPQALLSELGDSSVNFELRYWTAPDIATVVVVRDRVLSAAKRAVDEAGLTIPWPIRTLIVDGDSQIQVGQRP
ncbi:mechanosensitive ion channel family protein [Euzebya tangerina]|uniref:mechanosensitive ion channel family protein n=1 Tax=Euzebya tangerina TaxID=591198 RepID=UPI000E30E476|nr:mechanosensitive ion channel family protein [Euzebya tangerina]